MPPRPIPAALRSPQPAAPASGQFPRSRLARRSPRKSAAANRVDRTRRLNYIYPLLPTHSPPIAPARCWLLTSSRVLPAFRFACCCAFGGINRAWGACACYCVAPALDRLYQPGFVWRLLPPGTTAGTIFPFHTNSKIYLETVYVVSSTARSVALRPSRGRRQGRLLRRRLSGQLRSLLLRHLRLRLLRNRRLHRRLRLHLRLLRRRRLRLRGEIGSHFSPLARTLASAPVQRFGAPGIISWGHFSFSAFQRKRRLDSACAVNGT